MIFVFHGGLFTSAFQFSVRAAGVHVDGTTEAGRFVLVAPSSIGEARGCVQHDAARGHHHGFSQRVLRSSAAAGNKSPPSRACALRPQRAASSADRRPRRLLPHSQDYFVVLLSPMELDTTMRMILQVPIWAQRVIYIQGSCLKDGDLSRARMNEAEACFVLAARNYADKTAAVRKHTFYFTPPLSPLSAHCSPLTRSLILPLVRLVNVCDLSVA